MSEIGEREDNGSGMRDGMSDAEYVAVLRDLEPAGTAEFAEYFGVAQYTARRRLESLSGGHAPVESKKIGGSYVWFVDEAGLEADAAATVEEVRSRMGVE
jgi:hypothetical protein